MVQDINDDNYLDIIYHCSSGPQLIYWGSPMGYSDDSTTDINYYGRTSGGIIADLNNDDILDLFFNRMSSTSHVLWGPEFTSSVPLPVNNDHHAMFREIGNVYNRKFYDDYISSIFNAGDTVFWWTITWDADCPAESDISMSIRTGNTAIPDTAWSEWVDIDSNSMIHDSLSSLYIQYKSRLTYDDIAYFPILHEVRIGYDSISGISNKANRSQTPLLNILPNPFTHTITIDYTTLHQGCTVVIDVYDLLGRKVKTLINESQNKGTHSVVWNGNDGTETPLPSGTYFLKLQIDDNYTFTRLVYIQ
jgi:hypothetical protein